MKAQMSVFTERPQPVIHALEQLASIGGHKERGAVYTRREVVEALLDLCGYTTDLPLHEKRFLEPAFGGGDFLIPAIRRLIETFFKSCLDVSDSVRILGNAIRGVELHRATFQQTADSVEALLVELGIPLRAATELTKIWLIHDDFLLADIDGSFDVIIGNPPYVRQERIPKALIRIYKDNYSALYDRADLYILFYERGLDLLNTEGSLGYICANRWLKNKYGGPLRKMVASGFCLKYFIDMERVDAFHDEVIAYPAITVIERMKNGKTHVGVVTSHETSALVALAANLTSVAAGIEPNEDSVVTVKDVMNQSDPWLLDAPEVVTVLRALEARFPTLELADAKVGIGVATGADKVFIGEYEALPVEPARKLKLALAKDCIGEKLVWGGKGVVTPYTELGQLADFADFPRFSQYLLEHEARLRQRHTAKKQPDKWYKTIDRIYADLVEKPKLLIPDIKGTATVVYDEGNFYPHHNLYVVTSESWDLRALQAILRSSMAVFFVGAYCVRMSGGFLRFQAQYLRRIRVPQWQSLSAKDRQRLVEVSQEPRQATVDSVVLPLYDLPREHKELIRSYAASVQVQGKRRCQ